MTKAITIKNLQAPDGPQDSMGMCTTSAKIQTIKAAMNDQQKLLSILKSISIIPQDQTSVVHSDQIISTLKTPGVTTAKSLKKNRVWALLPDLGIANKPER